MRLSVLPVFFGLCVSAAAMAQQPSALYRPTVLQWAPSDYHYPGLLNSAGDYSVGSKSDGPSPMRSTLNFASGGSVDMGNFFALNEHGQAVGSDWEYQFETGEFTYFGSYLDNGSVHKFVPEYVPVALNNSGMAVGTASGRGSILFDISTGEVTPLPTLNGSLTYAISISDNGAVVGSAQNSDGSTAAFIYENGAMTVLPFGGTSSTAYSINASGDILGGYTDAAGLRHRVLYSNGVVTDITAIIGTPFNPSINDLGQILFEKGGVRMIYIDGKAYPIELVDFDPERSEVYMISDLNDEGQLLAMTCAPNSSYYCDVVRLDFVAVVPEPPAWLMLAAGVALVSRPWRRLAPVRI